MLSRRLSWATTNMLLGCCRHSQKSPYQALIFRSPAAATPSIPMRSFWGGRKPEEPLDFDPDTDYYKVLGLKKTASDKDIKNMYYKLCYEYHPDRTGGMHQDKFKEINNAY